MQASETCTTAAVELPLRHRCMPLILELLTLLAAKLVWSAVV
jgi:hypothetical protein